MCSLKKLQILPCNLTTPSAFPKALDDVQMYPPKSVFSKSKIVKFICREYSLIDDSSIRYFELGISFSPVTKVHYINMCNICTKNIFILVWFWDGKKLLIQCVYRNCHYNEQFVIILRKKVIHYKKFCVSFKSRIDETGILYTAVIIFSPCSIIDLKYLLF